MMREPQAGILDKPIRCSPQRRIFDKNLSFSWFNQEARREFSLSKIIIKFQGCLKLVGTTTLTSFNIIKGWREDVLIAPDWELKHGVFPCVRALSSPNFLAEPRLKVLIKNQEKLLSAFEPVRAYKSMLRDSQRHQATSKPTVTTLAVEYRLLYTLLVYCLAPRDLNHDDPTEVDLYLIFSLNETVRINWPRLILLNMLGFSTSSGTLGYPILISRIIEHALVDVSDTGYLITEPQENLILGQYINFHMDIYKHEGM
ncbi:hypothetical protein Lal_00014541 [Lupinus albus]|nr:hypothetical protein Lal_00014541 [Lupinus albus]